MRMVVVGCGTAGASAAFSARMKDRGAEIVLIGDEEQPTYSRCALPFVIAGEVSPPEKCIVFDEKRFRSQKIELIKPAKVVELDTDDCRVVCETGAGRREFGYDSLVLATGGYAAVPKIDGAELPGNYSLRRYEDALRIMEVARSGMSAIVNGASFIALELAEALKLRGLDVKLVVRSRPLRSFVDAQISRVVGEHLRKNGITLIEGAEIERIEGGERVESVVVGGEQILCEAVFHSTGTRPNVSLAASAGIGIGETGGVEVDEFARTSVENVYACGDCAEVEHSVSGGRVLSALGTIAMRHGVAAGENAAGGKRRVAPVLGATVMRLFGLEIGSAGLTEVQARDAGFDAFSVQTKYPSLPHYFGGGEEVLVRLVVERKSGKMIGGQVVCKSGAALRVDILSCAILNGMSVDEFSNADFCYSPPCSDVWLPEAVCANVAVRRLKR